MKILKTQVLRGPNIWSNYRKKLIQVRIDLEEMENFPTDKLPGFNDRLKNLLPGMIEHECSPQKRGGFFERLERGTWLGHVYEHIALEIQSLAGMETGFGRTRGTGEDGIYNVVFSYTVEEAGLYAAEAAFRIIEALRKNESYDLSKDIEAMREICRRDCFGPSTRSIVAEAERRGIPWARTGTNSSVMLGYGVNQKSFQATITCNTSLIAVERADHKDDTKKLLTDAKIPVPKGGVCRNTDELKQIVYEIGYPVVVKPLSGSQGRGASVNVCNWQESLEAFKAALEFGEAVIVEKYFAGADFRMLIIDNKFVAAARRIPAHVTGNGISTIEELIEVENSNPDRGEGHSNVLTKINIDAETISLLSKWGYNLKSVPPEAEEVFLKSTANLSTGGTAVDVTDSVHPENIFIAERISRVIGLDVCGIDIVATNLQTPISQNGGVILEVNAAPGFRMHLSPSEGKSRNVASAVLDMLYPPGKPSKIPIIGVTGTNGKTTTTRLLAKFAKNTGYRTGYTTTDGIYIDDFLVEKGDNTGPMSGGFVLHDPTVEFAVLETARGGILRSGLCFNECDVAVITNIREDHLGLNDINTLEELANVKAVLPRSVKKTGWAVLNADDPQCVNISEELDCNVAFFSLDEDNAVIKKQMDKGIPVAIYENGFITIITATESQRIEHVNRIPITFNGNAKFMVANALAASLAGFVWGFTPETIRMSLHGFVPGMSQTPGRLNHFDFEEFTVVVDYAHNPHGYTAMEEYLANVPAQRRIGIISGVGDRRDSDIRECAIIAGRMFDYIIIKQEHDLRGRTEDEINSILLSGIKDSKEGIPVEIISQETDAIKRALAIAQKGDLVVALCDAYQSVIEIIKEQLAEEAANRATESKNNAVDAVSGSVMINNFKNKYHGRTA